MRHDRLYDVRWHKVKLVMAGWLSNLDKSETRHPADIVMGAAVTFKLICERFDLNPREVMQTTDKVVSSARAKNPQYIRGMEMYLKEEISENG